MSTLVIPGQARPGTWDEFRGFVVAYTVLLGTRIAAEASGVDPREMPVALAHLRRWWMSDEGLLWMLYQRHVEHVVPCSGESDGKGPGVVATTRFGEKSAFVLVVAGEAFAWQFLTPVFLAALEGSPFEEAEALLRMGSLVPRYDAEERRFTWGRHLLKQFRQPAVNQELIVLTAEELLWPAWFDDPLGRGGVGHPKKRLHDAIQDLNRRQGSYLVHFKGDGSGARVGWELR